MITAFKYTDGTYMYLPKEAEIARKEMSYHTIRFPGTFDEVSMIDTIPHSLLAQVSMTKHGPDIESRIVNGITYSDLAISQLLLNRFHCYRL
jgi:hypothetical protein